MQTVAALTLVRDYPKDTTDTTESAETTDTAARQAYFLGAWVRYYAQQISPGHCYVISAGASQEMLDLAATCSVIRLPDGTGDAIARRRGRVLANMVASLGQYYTHVIVSGPAELVLADPQAGDLETVLAAIPGGQVLTPLGLELASDPTGPSGGDILTPGRQVRLAPDLSRPCIVSAKVALSRDGSLAKHNKLVTPDSLYLLGLDSGDSVISPADTTDDRPDRADGFDFAKERAQMHATWGRHENSGYWAFERPETYTRQRFRLPSRFAGMI